MAGVRNLEGAGCDLVTRHANLAENPVEIFTHLLQGPTQLISFRGQMHADIEIAPGDSVRQPCRSLQMGQHGIEVCGDHADFVPGGEIELLGRIETALGECLGQSANPVQGANQQAIGHDADENGRNQQHRNQQDQSHPGMLSGRKHVCFKLFVKKKNHSEIFCQVTDAGASNR